MLSDYKKIIFGISEKKDGPMKLANRDANIAEINRQKFFIKEGIDNDKVISAALANGLAVKIVAAGDQGKMIPGVDALVFKGEDIVLAITVADCLPIYFYNPVSEIIALAHAGWRGVIGNIVYRTISEADKIFINQPEDWQVYIGPHIMACHFEVQEDVVKMFSIYPEFIIEQEGKKFINLKGIVRKQLLEIGILESNINISEQCTFCEERKYFSYRRDKPQEVEAMVAYLGIRKG